MDIQIISTRIIELSLIALLVFTPLARGAVPVWAVSVTHFITLVTLTAYLVRIAFDGQFRWVRTPLDLPLIALFVLAVISALSSIDPYASSVALLRLANYLVLYFVIVNTIRRRDQVRRLAYTVTMVGSFLAVFGMIKYLGGACPPGWDHEVKYGGMAATFGCKDYLAGYMEMAIPMTIGLLVAERKGWTKALSVFALLFLCVGLTLTLSGGGWISGGFALSFMLLLYLVKTRKGYKGLMVAVVSVTTVVILTVLASTHVIEKLETLTHASDTPNWKCRTALWAGTLDLIRDYPLLGTGPGTFAIAFRPYRPEGLNDGFLQPHNDYLHFISETGVPIAGIILWLLGVAFWSGIRKIMATSSRLTLGITLGALTGILAITIHSAADFNLHIMANAILFTVLAGVLMSARTMPGSLLNTHHCARFKH